LLLTVGLLSGCHKDLSERPPDTTEPPSFQTTESTIGAMATVSLSSLSAMVNKAFPQSFAAGGNGEDACVKLLKQKICAGTRYNFTAIRTGAVAIAAAGPGTLRFTVPIAFDGDGGFRGSVARVIKAHKKHFKGAVIVIADLTPTLGSDWCPNLGANFSINWTSDPRVEIVSKVWVNVKDQVNSQLNKELPHLAEQLKGTIDCGRFKRQLESVYGNRAFPIEVPNAGALYVNLEPTNIGFSGLDIDDDLVKVAATLSAKTAVSTAPIETKTLPLPPFKTISTTTPRLSLAVPLRVGYSDITQIASRYLVGKTFEQDTAVGKIRVTIKGIAVYPSNKHLVLGADIDAKIPGKFFNTRGWVYVLGTPAVENGTKISLTDPAFSQVLDNDFWAVAAQLFEAQIKSEMVKVARYDLAPDIQKAKATLTASLSDPARTQGWKIRADDLNIKIGRIAVADKEFAAEGLVSASVVVEPSN
jgi:hypothetical protein